VPDVALSAIELCAGVGMLGEGLRAGLAYLGRAHRTVCHVEREAHAAAVLAARMEEGSLDAAPVWSDMLTFDGRRWRGCVDIVAAGFPCQDLSVAGRRVGLDGRDPACSSASSTLPTIAMRSSSFWRTSQESLVPQLPLWTKKAPPSMSGITDRKAFRKWALKMDAFSKERPPESWENWPTAGGTRNGSLFQRPTLALRTGANAGSALHGEAPSAWPTAKGSDGDKGGPNQAGSKGDLMLPSAAANWMTPHGMAGMDKNGKAGAGGNFAKQASAWRPEASTWGTPQARDYRSPDRPGQPGQPELSAQGARGNDRPEFASELADEERYTSRPEAHMAMKARMKGWPTSLQVMVQTEWQTPSGENFRTRGGNRSDELGLDRQVQAFSPASARPTPAARDSKGANSSEHVTTNGTGRMHMDQLPNFVEHHFFSPQAQQTRDGQESRRVPVPRPCA
jgi:hypothetical protein